MKPFITSGAIPPSPSFSFFGLYSEVPLKASGGVGVYSVCSLCPTEVPMFPQPHHGTFSSVGTCGVGFWTSGTKCSFWDGKSPICVFRMNEQRDYFCYK